MGIIERIYDFVAGTKIRSAEVDAELNQLVTAHNDHETAIDALEAGTGLVDGSVATAKLADLSVTAAKIALLAVTAAQIANSTITATQLADSSITSAKILDGSILDADINSSAAIAWTKLSKAGSSLADLATRLITDLTGVLAASQFPALTGDMTTTSGSLATTLSATGVLAGTYNNVTVDAKGRVTLGSNLIASSSQSGDLSAAKFAQFDALVPLGLGSYTVPAGTAFGQWSAYTQEQDPITGDWVFYIS